MIESLQENNDLPVNLYQYKAICTGAYDGDTITVDIDLGLYTWKLNVKCRLFGVDTPEMRGEEKEAGTISRDWLRGEILNQEILIETIKDKTGKYGRWLVIVWKDGRNINQELIDRGLAESYG